MQDTRNNTLVDVILPVRNYGRFLSHSARSVLTQSERRIRLLAIDYGSTDETSKILSALAAADPRVEVVTLPDGSLVEALNEGLGRATAPFIARQDADDISSPDRLRKQLAELEANPDVVAVSGSCDYIDHSGAAIDMKYAPLDPGAADYTEIPAVEPYLLQPFLMVRSSIFRAVGGYRAGFVSFAEDTDLYWRLSRIGRLANLPVSLGSMRLHSGSLTNKSAENGRILAIYSQLAALSRRRTDLSRPSLEPQLAWLGALREAGTLSRMIEFVGASLDREERRYLTAAASAKLLELSSNRSFELDLSDCRYIGRVYAGLPTATLRENRIANWAYRAALVRLLRRGELQKLVMLARPAVLAKLALLRLLGGRGARSRGMC